MTIGLFVVLYDAGRLFLFYYHYLSYLLTLASFWLLSYASYSDSITTDEDTLTQRIFSVAIAVNYCATAFYWSVAYNDEFNQTADKTLWITPLLVGLFPSSMLTVEYISNAIAWDSDDWEYSVYACAIYLFLDLARGRFTGENLVYTFTWNDEATFLYACLLLAF